MLAYRGDSVIKRDILAQLAVHREAGELTPGWYPESVGRNPKLSRAIICTIHSEDLSEYESRLGIPQLLARLKSCIFEGLPHDAAVSWPERFMNAIRPSSDLSRVGWQFLRWLLSDQTVNPGINHPFVKHAVARCAGVLVPLAQGTPVNADAASEAKAAGEAAALAQLSTESSICRLPTSAFAKVVIWTEWGVDLSAPGSSAEWARRWSEFAVELSAAKSSGSENEWAALLASWSADSAKWAAAAVEAWPRCRKLAANLAAESAAWAAAGLVENAAYAFMADKLVEIVDAASRGPEATA